MKPLNKTPPLPTAKEVEESTRDVAQSSRDWATTFMENLPAATHVVNRQGVFVEVNEHCARQVFGLSSAEIVGKSLRDVFPREVAEELWENDVAVLDEGRVLQFEEIVPHADDGEPHAYLSTKFPLRDSQGTPYAVAGISFEITERKMAQVRTESLLREKSLLLKELRHRVKNNLQLISSLLNLQASKTTSANARDELTAVRTRIEAIASLYDRLQPAGIEDRIYIRKYINELLTGVQSIQTDPTKVTIQTDIDDLRLHIDDASPLGLIINELSSNALKHAFPGGKKGTVNVQIRSLGGRKLRLVVSDNGVGLTRPPDESANDSMGFRLVKSLVEYQLGGSLAFSTNAGTTVTVQFETR